MGNRRALIEMLSGAPVSRGAPFRAAGLDPEGAMGIRRMANRRRAIEEAKDEGGSASFGEKLMASVGQAYGGPYAMAEPFVRDPGKDPGPLRSARATNPYGASAENRAQEREALRGEKTPGALSTQTRVVGRLPGYGPMLEDGQVSPLGVGKNVLAVLLMLAGLPPGAREAQAGATAAGATAAEASAAASSAATGQAAYLGSQAAGAALPEVLPDRVQDDPYSMAAINAALSTGTNAAGATGNSNLLGDLGNVLRAPGSLAPDMGEGVVADLGRSTVGALPTVGGTSQDLAATLAAQKRSRFRRLMRRASAPPLARVPDPFGVIPDRIGG